MSDDDEYVFAPGDHEYMYEEGRTRVRVTLHAGDGITKKQFEPTVRLICHFRDENERKRREQQEAADER